MHEFEGQFKANGRQTQTRLYRIWRQMRHRCNCETSVSYPKYGGRGIKVCADWDSFEVFRSWALANGYTEALTLDRYPDNDGNYEPSNCRWASYLQQSENRRNTRLIEVNGVTKTMAAWGKQTGIHMTTLYRRYHQGVRGADFIKPTIPRVPGVRTGRLPPT